MGAPPTAETPVREFVLRDDAPYGYKKELEALAWVFYLFYRQNYEVSPVERAVQDFGAEPITSYSQIHLRHLILMMMEDSALPRKTVSLSDYMTHPFFKKPAELTEFETRLWSYVSARRGDANGWLDANSASVFAGLWTDHVPERVWNIPGRPAPSENDRRRLTRLWNIRRNRRIHRDDDEEELRDLMGRPPADNFDFWESHFPRFSLHLFRRMATYRAPGSPTRLCEHPEFRPYYSASRDFYILSDRIQMGGGDAQLIMGRSLEWR